MRLDPARHVLVDIGLLVGAVVHGLVLGVDGGYRQCHHAEQLGRCGILLDELAVGHDALVVHDEAVVLAVGQGGAVGAGILAGGHLQPHHVLARLEHIAHPVGRPGVIEDGLALLVARDGVGDQRGVVALHVLDVAAQLEFVQVLLDGFFAAPPGVAAGQVGLAVAIGVEQLGNGGVLHLLDAGDLVLLGGLAVDQVALQRASGIGVIAPELAVAAGVLVEVFVQAVPVVGHEGGVAVGDGQVGGGVVHFLDGLDLVAELLQRLHHQLGLEGFFGDRALQRLDADALAGLFVAGVGVEGGQADQAGAEQGAGKTEGGGKQGHGVPFGESTGPGDAVRHRGGSGGQAATWDSG